MDFLNKSFAQLSDLFKSMTPGARITAGLLVLVIVVSLGFLFQRQSSGPDAFLMGGEPIPHAQLAPMEAAFNKAKLSGYSIDGNRIRVPRGQQAAYMGALADAGALPANFGTYLEKALASESPFAMRGSREEKIKLAKQQELQLILSNMRGIQSASVIYDIRDKRTFGQQAVSTASVSVVPEGILTLDADQVRMIRHTVASSFAGLNPENVTVTDLTGSVYVGGGDKTGLGATQDDAYASRKKMYEQEWSTKVLSALSFIPGVRVGANVELDTQMQHEESSTTYDSKVVPYNQKETTDTKSVEPAPPTGNPGLAAQGGVNQPVKIGMSAGVKSSEERTQTEAQSRVPTTTKHTAQHGLTPKDVKISIGVPSSYYEKVFEIENPVVAGEQPKKPLPADLDRIRERIKTEVERATVALLPPTELPADKYPRINVFSFVDLPVTAPALPGMQEHAVTWLAGNWSTLAMVGLGVFGLMFLRSMVKSMPVTTVASAQALDTAPSLSLVTGGPGDESAEAVPTRQSRLKRRGGSGPSLRDDLADMVREDPDAAVSILRNWIGSAG